MGFSRSFIGGATLSAGIMYLTMYKHQQNRQIQAAALRSQSQILTGFIESNFLPLFDSETKRLSFGKSISFTQNVKIRWNEQIENTFWWVHSIDWSERCDEVGKSILRIIGKNSS
ncbi:hypothetical protein HI914_03573 [Erysiphe necator]|nr:hypothetical protein HI914_03573 [Erysiphe necator]